MDGCECTAAHREGHKRCRVCGAAWVSAHELEAANKARQEAEARAEAAIAHKHEFVAGWDHQYREALHESSQRQAAMLDARRWAKAWKRAAKDAASELRLWESGAFDCVDCTVAGTSNGRCRACMVGTSPVKVAQRERDTALKQAAEARRQALEEVAIWAEERICEIEKPGVFLNSSTRPYSEMARHARALVFKKEGEGK